jgi:hypothetical protein
VLQKMGGDIKGILRQDLIPTPNASHWSHITPVNMLYPVLLKLKADEVLAKDRLVCGCS